MCGRMIHCIEKKRTDHSRKRKGVETMMIVSAISPKAWLWIIAAVILSLAVGVPLLAAWLRKRDFEKQVRGKRKERTIGDRPVPTQAPKTEVSNTEAMQDEAWLKAKQNAFGPK